MSRVVKQEAAIFTLSLPDECLKRSIKISFLEISFQRNGEAMFFKSDSYLFYISDNILKWIPAVCIAPVSDDEGMGFAVEGDFSSFSVDTNLLVVLPEQFADDAQNKGNTENTQN